MLAGDGKPTLHNRGERVVGPIGSFLNPRQFPATDRTVEHGEGDDDGSQEDS